MTITVTQEDINIGARRNCCHCPVARAASRYFSALFEKAKVEVAGGKIWIVLPDRVQKIFKLPESANRFIGDFDGDLEVAPFSFELTDEVKISLA